MNREFKINRVSVAFSDQELDLLRRAAQQEMIAPSTFARRAALREAARVQAANEKARTMAGSGAA